MTVSAAFLVREPPIDRLAALVELLRPIVGEFVIVDTGSDAADLEAMRSWPGTKVIERVWRDDFSWARNEGLAECTGDWTLVLDPDEIPSLAMLEHVRAVDAGTVDVGHDEWRPIAAGWLYWTDNFWAGVLGPPMPYHWHCRLFKTGAGRFYRPIHELVALRPAGFEWMGEELTRGTPILPPAPQAAKLIHSKGRDEITKADAQYATMAGPEQAPTDRPEAVSA